MKGRLKYGDMPPGSFKRIYHGDMCKYGHGHWRYNSNRACVECCRLRAAVQNAQRAAARKAKREGKPPEVEDLL